MAPSASQAAFAPKRPEGIWGVGEEPNENWRDGAKDVSQQGVRV